MINAYTGSRAEHVINGAIMIVASRSRGLAIVRVAMIPGIAHAKLDSSGMNERPGQADAAHHAVEQECGARQVAGILEHEDEEEQDQDLRQEHHHAADACQDAIEQQAAQCVVRQHGLQVSGERFHAGEDRVHRYGRPGEDRLEHEEQRSREYQQPQDRMQHDAIDAIAHSLAGPCFATGRRENTSHFGVIAHDVCVGGRRSGTRNGSRPMRVETAEQLAHTRGSHADGLDHGNAEFASERVLVDDDAAFARQVAHVEREQQRHAEPLQREHEAQVLTKVGRVGDADDGVGFRFAVAAAEQDVSRDLLVGRCRLEAVQARADRACERVCRRA